jgi:hypothetical protein
VLTWVDCDWSWGASEVTVVVVLNEPTFILKSSRATWFSTSVRPVCSSDWKPGASAVTL